jgi:hypothetical protein
MTAQISWGHMDTLVRTSQSELGSSTFFFLSFFPVGPVLEPK